MQCGVPHIWYIYEYLVHIWIFGTTAKKTHHFIISYIFHYSDLILSFWMTPKSLWYSTCLWKVKFTRISLHHPLKSFFKPNDQRQVAFHRGKRITGIVCILHFFSSKNSIDWIYSCKRRYSVIEVRERTFLFISSKGKCLFLKEDKCTEFSVKHQNSYTDFRPTFFSRSKSVTPAFFPNPVLFSQFSLILYDCFKNSFVAWKRFESKLL